MKQVIVVNESLALPRGKLAAQVAHAAVDAFLLAPEKAQRRWLREGMPKIVLKGESTADLQQLLATAQANGLPAALIEDAGHTVIEAGTVTCLGIGPADEEAINRLTGDRKLLK